MWAGAQIIGADKYEWTVQESGAAIEDADKAVAKLNVTEAGVYHVTLKQLWAARQRKNSYGYREGRSGDEGACGSVHL